MTAADAGPVGTSGRPAIGMDSGTRVASIDAGSAGMRAAPPSGCPTLAAGVHSKSLRYDERERAYVVYVPRDLVVDDPRPLVVDLHGALSSPAGQQRISGWEAIADREKLIAVYPNGVGSSWNVGTGCCSSEGVDDIGFVRAVVEQVSTELCVDSDRVYASGDSIGGAIAHRLGCEAADLFAAVAPVSSDLQTQPCTPARPISVIAFRGTADDIFHYEGGPVPGFVSPGAKGSLEQWRTIDQCTGAPAMSERYCESYTQCAGGVEVALCSLPDAGHGLYENSLDFEVAETAWRMFERQPMRPMR